MMREELGIIDDNKKPSDTAITTFITFNALGLIPLIPFIISYAMGIFTISSTTAFIYSVIFTGISFFVIGAVKGKIINKSLVKSGLYTLLIGGIASAAAYTVGHVLGAYIE